MFIQLANVCQFKFALVYSAGIEGLQTVHTCITVEHLYKRHNGEQFLSLI